MTDITISDSLKSAMANYVTKTKGIEDVTLSGSTWLPNLTLNLYSTNVGKTLNQANSYHDFYSTDKASQAVTDINGISAYTGDVYRTITALDTSATTLSQDTFTSILSSLTTIKTQVDKYPEVFNNKGTSETWKWLVTNGTDGSTGTAAFGTDCTWGGALLIWKLAFDNLYSAMQSAKTASTSPTAGTASSNNASITATGATSAVTSAITSAASTASTGSSGTTKASSTGTTGTAAATGTTSTDIPTSTSTPTKWGVKFTHKLSNGKDYSWYMALGPAMESVIPLQGSRGVPGAGPGGLTIRAKPLIAEHIIPGFGPLIQHLGISSTVVSFVGAFVGYEGYSASDVDGFYYEDTTNTSSSTISKIASLLTGTSTSSLTSASTTFESPSSKNVDSYAAFCRFWEIAIRSGSRLTVEIQVASPANDSTSYGSPSKNSLPTTTLLRGSGGNPTFTGYINKMEAMYSRRDRTWYSIELKVIALNTNKPLAVNCDGSSSGTGSSGSSASTTEDCSIRKDSTADGSLGYYKGQCKATQVTDVLSSTNTTDLPYNSSDYNVWVIADLTGTTVTNEIWLEKKTTGCITKGGDLNNKVAKSMGIVNPDNFISERSGNPIFASVGGKIYAVTGMPNDSSVSSNYTSGLVTSSGKTYRRVTNKTSGSDVSYDIPVEKLLYSPSDTKTYATSDSTGGFNNKSYSAKDLESGGASCTVSTTATSTTPNTTASAAATNETKTAATSTTKTKVSSADLQAAIDTGVAIELTGTSVNSAYPGSRIFLKAGNLVKSDSAGSTQENISQTYKDSTISATDSNSLVGDWSLSPDGSRICVAMGVAALTCNNTSGKLVVDISGGKTISGQQGDIYLNATSAGTYRLLKSDCTLDTTEYKLGDAFQLKS